MNNKKIVSISLFKTGILILFTTFMLAATTAYAEYYVVYSGAGTQYVSSCCKGCSVRHHKHYKQHYKYKKVYKKHSNYQLRSYVVWPTCGGSFRAPRCGGNVQWAPARCSSCDANFYVPPEYIQGYRSDYYYYDTDPDMDMRTSDDF